MPATTIGGAMTGERRRLMQGLGTRLVHGAEPHPRIRGAAVMPIFQSSTFEWSGAGEDGANDVPYLRHNNTPNQLAVAEKIALLEGAEAALVTGSGMAAISATLMTLLDQGSHVLTIPGLYGATYELLASDLSRFGVESSVVDPWAPHTWKDALRPETRVFYVETMTNPLVRVPRLADVVAFARDHGLVSITDNTFATPANFAAVDFGFDVSVHSCSKYLNGHSDLVAGAVLGSQSMIRRIKRTLNHLGGTLDPHAAFLLQRGLKTLALRMARHNASGLAMAEWLARHPAIAEVSYPGLPTHPDHALASGLFQGFGGVLAFRLKDDDPTATDALLSRLELPMVGGSLGGPETLVIRPAVTTHAGMPAAERARAGIADTLVRLSVGLEDIEDLIGDFDRALPG